MRPSSLRGWVRFVLGRAGFALGVAGVFVVLGLFLVLLIVATWLQIASDWLLRRSGETAPEWVEQPHVLSVDARALAADVARLLEEGALRAAPAERWFVTSATDSGVCEVALGPMRAEAGKRATVTVHLSAPDEVQVAVGDVIYIDLVVTDEPAIWGSTFAETVQGIAAAAVGGSIVETRRVVGDQVMDSYIDIPIGNHSLTYEIGFGYKGPKDKRETKVIDYVAY